MVVGTIAHARILYLAQRIIVLASRSEWVVGHHLTEHGLVDALGVSRTPVRAALRELEEQGIVEARLRRGYFLCRNGRDLVNTQLREHPTVEEELHNRILRDHASGVLPSAVTAGEISQTYEANRGVVARVLIRMQDDGLVRQKGGREWHFTSALGGLNGARLSYEFRLIIEPAALLLPGFQINSFEFDELRASHVDLLKRIGKERKAARVDPVEIFMLDANFHEALAEATQNHFILESIRQQNKLRKILEFGSYGAVDRIREWSGEHLRVLDAIKARDMQLASRRLREHLFNAMSTVISADQKKQNRRGATKTARLMA
jgi:DNA-binding GntR family transcriptional regulator